MEAFHHFSPKSLEEAIGLLSRFEQRGRVIAGGTDLVLKMRAGTLNPEAVIDIKGLAALQGMDYDSRKGLRMGALVTLQDLALSELIEAHYPCLTYAASRMASVQIRNFATVGGNLCNASPSADLAPPLIALQAEISIVGPAGDRRFPLDEFFLGPEQTVLKTDELLKEILIPPPQGRTIYLKHAPRTYMDIALVGVAVHLKRSGAVCQAARVVLGAVAPTPLRARRAEDVLIGQPLSATTAARAAALAAEESAPIDDAKGSAWYRRRMVEVLTRRVLMAFLESEETGS